ncbi:MAG: SelB C-terminal domain-containing protein, partial [Dehalococcoidia bacterium]|nr:SelB C-terminal domain-containing protein [Dehalococcoidia bacterium]
LPDAPHPIRHNASVSFYIGAAETEARVRLLDKELLSPGDTGWAQILLDAPVAVVKGDLFIVRSSKNTLGGGEVVDSHARRHRRFHGQTIENLGAREKGAPEEVIINTLEVKGPLDLSRLTVQSNLPSGDVKALLDSLLREDRVLMMGDKPSTALLFSREGWLRFRDRAVGIVQSYYKQFPLRITMPKEALRTRMKLTPQAFSNVLKRLFREGALVEDDLAVRLAGRNVELTRAQRVTVDAYLASLAKNPYSPPGCLEPDAELLNFMMEQHQVVRVSDNVIFAASAFDEMVGRISDHIKSQGKVGLTEVKDMFRTSRKYAVSLLEYLDRQ